MLEYFAAVDTRELRLNIPDDKLVAIVTEI